MWIVFPGWPRLHGWYQGNSSSVNGIYHKLEIKILSSHIKAHVYVHRSNAIIAFGPGTCGGNLPCLQIASAI